MTENTKDTKTALSPFEEIHRDVCFSSNDLRAGLRDFRAFVVSFAR